MIENKEKQAKVYLIDDNQSVLDSSRYLIESVGYEVETFKDALLFLENGEITHPCCIVVDVRMPNMSGLELQERLNERGTDIPLIFMTGHGDVPMAVQAMKNGAMEFLSKPVNNQKLLESINKAIRFDKEQSEKIEKKKAQEALLARLTSREKEVLELLVNGNSTKAIAEALGISPHTAELHRAKVMKKMQAKTLADLVREVLTNGLGQQCVVEDCAVGTEV